MKKLITILATLMLTGPICFGQIGLGAGFVKQSLNEKNSHPLAGLYVKADYTIPIWKQLAVSVGLDYSRLTATLSGKAGDVWISSPTAGSEADIRSNFSLCRYNCVTCRFPAQVGRSLSLADLLWFMTFLQESKRRKTEKRWIG